jgi:glycerophosphoryl diester phosphodiesterase
MVDVPFISVHYFSATFFNKRIQQHRQNGTRVWVWTVNNTKKLQSLQSKGIDGITTDYPNLVR